MQTRTGPHAAAISAWYSSGRSRPSLSAASDITCHRTWMSRTFSTSRIHRLVIHAQGHIGSNQKSALAMADILPLRDRLQHVTAENLTRDEARERARLLEVAQYDVELDLTPAPTDSHTFRSTSSVRFTCTEPGASTHIDITADRILEATLNGAAIDIDRAFTGRRLQLPPLAASNELRVVADCIFMRTGEGLHRFTDPVDKETYLYTQFETFDAHRMFACFDQPDLKATFSFAVDAPSHCTVISNMPSTRGEVAENHDRRRWLFEPTPRQSTYITALVAGAYYSVYDEHDGIPLGLFCRQSLAEFLDADELFRVTKQ